ncbi:MAG: RimK family alpha-L-glutamate ligase [Planctomycetota bacterium]
MNVLILSRNRFLYSTRRLVKACRMRGHGVQIANPLAGTLTVGPHGLELTFEGKPVRCDCMIPRIGHTITDHGLAVVSQIEMMGIPTVNSRNAMYIARDKALALQTLASAALPVPPTAMTRNPVELEQAVEAVGGLPVVLKTIRGTQGIGVMLLDSMVSLRSIFDTMRSVNQDVMVQKFYTESAGCDVRVIIIGGRVVAAMRRHSAQGDFRANIHRGGKGEMLTLDGKVERLAIAAANVMGLDVAGVDLLETNDGPMIIEVNSCPGLEGIEEATGSDIADLIVEHAERMAGAEQADSVVHT